LLRETLANAPHSCCMVGTVPAKSGRISLILMLEKRAVLLL
jgi:hypothetical protein